MASIKKPQPSGNLVIRENKPVSLSKSARGLVNAVKNIFGLSHYEASVIGKAMLDEITDHIGDGDNLAFVKKKKDGKSELTIYNVYIKEKGKK
jgi:hypothetical protein